MRTVFIALLLSLSASVAHASLEELQRRLAAFEQLDGRFQQQLLSDSGAALESSNGRFAFLRPAYFRWHILEPEEQLLIAAGRTFWHYDVELETATRRSIDPGNPASPLAILSGDIRVLADYYDIQQLNERSWTLTPLSTDAEFVSVTLSFDHALPTRMQIRDKLGRTTEIQFGELDTDPSLAPEDFSFTPPEGVDIYADEP